MFFIALVSIFLTWLSQILLKLGAEDLNFSHISFNLFLEILKNKYILLGVLAMWISMFLWLIVLKKIDVSIAYPLVSLNFVFLTIVGYYCFDESLNLYKILGIAFIIIWVFFIYYLGQKW